MRLRKSFGHTVKSTPSGASFFTRLGKDEQGSTAIEFAMVSIPFLIFIFSSFAIAMHFFTTSALENGVDTAARKLRTGQAQASAMTNEQFKNEICASSFIDCSKLEIHVSGDNSWANVTPATCTDGSGGLASGSGASGGLVGDQGGCAGQAFVVTACYEWDLAKIIPLIDVGSLSSGAGLIQASAAGRSEPHQFACP